MKNSKTLSISNPRVEYKTNPIGIDEKVPRFSWEIISSQRNTLQTAYQIRVAGSPDDLSNAQNLIWDSRKVIANTSNQVEYAGAALESRTRYYWQVKIWDNFGQETNWSAPSFWEMALLSQND